MKLKELFKKPEWKFSVYCGYPCYTCSKCGMSVGRVQPVCPACRRKVLKVEQLKLARKEN